MKKPNPLNYKLLRRTLKPTELDFESTSELKSLTEFLGQERALEAVSFGVGIKSQGYNLYAMGPTGIGKRSLIRKVLEEYATEQVTPPDWSYLYNFDAPDKPIVIKLPPGIGLVLQQDMKSLITELSTSILAVFESDQYNNRMQEINKEFNSKRKKIGKRITEMAKRDKIPRLYKDRHAKEKELQLRLTSSVVVPLVNKIKKKYVEFTPVVEYLTAVQVDIIDNVNELIRRDENTNVLSFAFDSPLLVRYQTNLLVDNSKTKGAPIIIEENPSYSNLICRVEHTTQYGTLITNFTLIKPGSIHRANGGYLIIEARKLKKNQHAWEGLKRALYLKKIVIEPVEHLAEPVRSISLDPMPIPLDIKIILLGDRSTYYALCNHDPDFSELFKVAVDFDEEISRSKRNIHLYARLIATIARREGLLPFDASAVAAIIDHSTRIAEDVEKISTHISSIDDLILESNYWASIDEKKSVEAIDVKRALKAQIHRMDRARDQYYESINRNFVMIDTEKKAIGQLNCLSVVKVGNFSYGHPTRVTAKVRLGRGKIIDIQREINLAGPIHAKASLTLANFLAGRYNRNNLFSIYASVSFEQIYGMVEGDSASVAELCALISAIAEVPLIQSLAVTGSINQYGDVQAIGGVNEKIEGFFDICKARGLNGKHGVLIPAVNISNLMLREDVVEAAKQKKFFIYPIETVDDAITLLTGFPAGKERDNKFEKNSINYKVEKHLEIFSKNYKVKK